MAFGKVVQIIGPVIDCEFVKGEVPKINEAIRIMRKTPSVSSDSVSPDQEIVKSDDDVYCEDAYHSMLLKVLQEDLYANQWALP